MQSESGPTNFFSWSILVKYAAVSAINLAILLVGVAIGVLLIPHIEQTASASRPLEPQYAAIPQTPVAPAPASPKITVVTPTMSAGTIGIYLVLSHHIQSDELVVNGIDILKLNQEELNLLSKFVSPQQIGDAINRSRATELYQVGNPPATPSSSPK